MAIVGVLPSAGYAERLQPLEGSKEVIEVGGRPLIDFLVERMHTGGADELRVVTRPEKQDVIAYAEGVGATVVLGHPANINESFAAGMVGLGRDDMVLLGFPDSIWEPVDGYLRLVEAVERGDELALGLFDAPGVVGSDYLRLDAEGRIVGFDIKPERPASTWIWGAAAARVRALEGLEREEWPSAFMDARRRQGLELRGIPLSDSYVDIGTKETLWRTLASSS
jgi:glucose-1-phosphate thymidylyltransferase